MGYSWTPPIGLLREERNCDAARFECVESESGGGNFALGMGCCFGFARPR